MAAPTLITKELFTGYGNSCRVFSIQAESDKIAQDAKASGKRFEDEMHAAPGTQAAKEGREGYKDYAAFAKSCPQFALTCWPEEFAELGSGFVLYFQFLFFMALILCLAVLFQLPALAAYSGEDWLQGWYWHDWQSAWSDNSDNCKCLGSNNGFSVGSVADYGSSCKAWDAADCGLVMNASSKNRACCATWCFAAEKCQAPASGTRYLWNVHVKDMVRATSPCTQDPVTTAKCSSLPDNPYTGLGLVEVPDGHFIPTSWMSPGNFGPDQADSQLIPFAFLGLVCAISLATLVMFQHQLYTDAKVDAGTTSPNDFAILVKGLPTTATDDDVIKKFFSENAVKGKTDTEIVKVVIGWEVSEYRKKMKEIRELSLSLREIEVADPAYKETQKKILQHKSDLASAAKGAAARLRSSGIVVVVFRYQADLRACLDRWTGFWPRWFYSNGEDSCCLPTGNALWKGAALERFPFGNPPVPVNQIHVERAANPGDIHWEELGMDPGEKRTLFMKTNGAMIVITILGFGFTYLMNWLQSYLKDKEEKSTGGTSTSFRFMSFLPGLGLAMTNMFLMISARKLGDREYHDTWTTQEFSQGAKMMAALFVNTAGVLLFANLQPSEWYEAGGLLDDALMIFLFDAILPPIMFYFDIKYKLAGYFKRKKLTQARIDGWNKTIAENTGSSKEEEAAKNGVKAEVNAFKELFKHSEMDNPRRYANALNTFFCTLFFSPVFPFAPLIGVLGLFLQYWIDKYLLLRWYTRPKRPYNARLAQWSLRLVKYLAPLGVSVAFFFFLTPSWEDKSKVRGAFLLSLVVAAVMIFVPSIILRTVLGLGCIFRTNSYEMQEDGQEDYYQAQYAWSKEMKYHKDHFLYKNLSEALNPEMLDAKNLIPTKIDVIQGGYADAASHEADGVGLDDAVALKGGRKVGGASWGVSAGVPDGGGVTGAGAPAPVSYGAATAPPVPSGAKYGIPAPADVPAAAEAPLPSMPTPVAPPAAADALGAPEPAAAAPTPHRPSAPVAPVWEYEGNHGNWDPFNDDCQAYIEKEYMKFTGGGKGKGKGKGKLNVRTSGKQVSIDFEKMTSKVEDSKKIRNIRRRESE